MGEYDDDEIEEAEVLEVEAIFGGVKVPTCCHVIMTNPIMKFALMLPMGAIVSLLFSAIGLTFVASGLDGVDEMLSAADVDLGQYFDVMKTFSNFFFVTGLIVGLEGLREKFRIRWGMFTHCNWCLCWLMKCAIFKPLMLLILILFFVAALIALVVIEALYITIWTLYEACDASSEAVEDILDLAGGYGSDASDRVDKVCDSIKDGKSGGEETTTGLVLILFGQIVAIGYWYKYTTLGSVHTSKETEDEEAARDEKF